MAGTKGIMMAFAFVLVAFHFTSSETLTNGKLHQKLLLTQRLLSKLFWMRRCLNLRKTPKNTIFLNDIYRILLLVLASKIILKGVFLGSPFI